MLRGAVRPRRDAGPRRYVHAGLEDFMSDKRAPARRGTSSLRAASARRTSSLRCERTGEGASRKPIPISNRSRTLSMCGTRAARRLMMPRPRARGHRRQGAGDPEGHREAVAIRASAHALFAGAARHDVARSFPSIDYPGRDPRPGIGGVTRKHRVKLLASLAVEAVRATSQSLGVQGRRSRIAVHARMSSGT